MSYFDPPDKTQSVCRPLRTNPCDPIQQMVRELEAAGWSKWEGHMFVWKSPKGHLFRGPAKAHEIMLKDWEKTL